MRKLAVSLYLALAAAPAFAASNYSLTVLGRDYSVFSLNNAGVGVGNSPCCTGTAQIFSKDGVAAVDLPSSITTSYAYAINDANAIVGQAGGWPSGHAYIMQNGVYRDIAFKGTASLGIDINNVDTVLVNYGGQGSPTGSYLWSESGGVVELGGLGGGLTQAVAINDRGQVAGKSVGTDGTINPFLWENGTMTDLSSFGVRGDSGYNLDGISERGDVFGATFGDTGSRAWAIRDGSIAWYDDLAKISYIDTSGRIFGFDQQNNAVIVEGTTTTLIGDLIQGEPGWTFQLEAVNANGDILSTACRNGDCGYTVLLSAVPEPATYAMLLLGGYMTYDFARRRQRRG